jgi:hypothetical protein
MITVKNFFTRWTLALLLLLTVITVPVGSLVFAGEALAVTTANITITVTPGAVGISVNATSYDFGTIITGGTGFTLTSYFGITNSSTVITNHSIGVTAATWTGGATAWTHSNTATAGADTIGMNANAAGTWGVSDVIVKSSALNNIKTNQAATTGYAFGLEVLLPTSTTVNDQKTNVVQITVSAS